MAVTGHYTLSAALPMDFMPMHLFVPKISGFFKLLWIEILLFVDSAGGVVLRTLPQNVLGCSRKSKKLLHADLLARCGLFKTALLHARHS